MLGVIRRETLRTGGHQIRVYKDTEYILDIRWSYPTEEYILVTPHMLPIWGE